jgi:hypothetical protein
MGGSLISMQERPRSCWKGPNRAHSPNAP